MTALPAASAFTAEPMTAQALSDALVAVRDYLAGVAGTDGTQAGALAALGALAGRYEARTTTGSVAAGDRGKWLGCTGSWTLSLLAAATAGAGFAVIVANAGSGTITVDPADAETIDGAATATLEAGRAAILISTGSGWASAALPGAGGGPLLAPAAGTAAAPALAFPGDADTGIYRSAANTLGLSAGGTARALLSSSAFQIDVPVTGTAVQSSVTDTTAGRLALVGAFGLGQTGLLSALGDVNSTSTATGWWYYNSGTTNYASLPAAAQGNGLMRVERRAGDTLVQTVHLMNLSGGVWVRGYATSTWGPWQMLYTQATALGTVSQSGGVPTGAIIETGSGANGSYTRLADGTQFCAISINETDTAWSTASGSIYVRASVLAWTYPAAFSASPVMSATVRRATLSGGGANINSISTTGCDCTPWAAVSVAASNSKFVHLTAIGRWY